MIRYLRIVLISFVLFTPYTSARSQPQGVTMHRQAAGELDASGWTTADSTLGGFSVRLPLPFNDFTVAGSPSEGQVAKTFVVGAKSIEGVKFSAARIEYRNSAAVRSSFARIESGNAFAGKAARVEQRLVRGRKAVDVSMGDDATFGYFRYVLLDGSLIAMVVEVPAASRDLVSSAMVQTFFDSLRVTRP